MAIIYLTPPLNKQYNSKEDTSVLSKLKLETVDTVIIHIGYFTIKTIIHLLIYLPILLLLAFI